MRIAEPQNNAHQSAFASPAPWRWLALALVVVTVILTTVAHQLNLASHERRELARLQTIATFKVEQIVSWHAERMGDAELLKRRSHLYAGLIATWIKQRDTAAWRDIQSRLDDYRTIHGYRSIMLLDASGQVFGEHGESNGAPAPGLLTAVRQAISTGNAVGSDLYPSTTPNSSPQIAFIAPLQLPDGGPVIAIALVSAADQYLYPLIQSWPVPSNSAESLLFRRDGNDVLYINDLRFKKDAALKFRLPADTPGLIAGQSLRGEAATGSIIKGPDYRGNAVQLALNGIFIYCVKHCKH
ncbi:MAG: cache domain-containing protein [Dechloromonas sp.]|nr:cache domain-containing protein [Dechloromonas sp.]